ncbi:hypothetical protein NDU88_000470 [Pleurodeles waltl]|uniref:Uncharacterized protein n=1 Tax=Pleurodeles waltl TaxID=8319 RepID=A0AAV7NCA6_PLEWA|nr:hypothetical protein NDU88_000470 [Pleurodeles waltl]
MSRLAKRAGLVAWTDRAVWRDHRGGAGPNTDQGWRRAAAACRPSPNIEVELGPTQTRSGAEQLLPAVPPQTLARASRLEAKEPLGSLGWMRGGHLWSGAEGTWTRNWGPYALVDYRVARSAELDDRQVCKACSLPVALLVIFRARGVWSGGAVSAEGNGGWTVCRCPTSIRQDTPTGGCTRSRWGRRTPNSQNCILRAKKEQLSGQIDGGAAPSG